MVFGLGQIAHYGAIRRVEESEVEGRKHRLWGSVKTRLTLTDFLLHQVRSEFRSSGVFV